MVGSSTSSQPGSRPSTPELTRPARDLILAIDQGTSAIKVILFDLDGRKVASAGAETPLSHPRPSWMESDAESWWVAIVEAVRAVLATPGVRSKSIRAIGLCGFMHTLVPVDANGQALYAPILWPDQRAAAEVAELTERHGDLFLRTVGRLPTTMLAASRLLWLRRNAPAALDRAHSFLLSKDILRFRLTGELATDRRDAEGTGLIERTSGRWSAEILALADVDVAKLPPILRPDQVAGLVSRAAAEATGLPAGTPVVTGTGDWPCTVIGSGCSLPERVCFYLGTAGILGAYDSAVELDRLGSSHYYGSVTSTGSALRWVRELLAPNGEVSFADLCAEAAAAQPGARGLHFIPHLMGERGGGIRPAARGTFHGLTLAHRRPDLLRAVLEGTAYWLKTTTSPYLIADQRAAAALFVAFGGGARSALWRQIFAAIFGRSLAVPEVFDAGALGAAMLAAIGTGLRDSYAALGAEWVRIVGVEQPDPALADFYTAGYARFSRVEAALEAVENKLIDSEADRWPSPIPSEAGAS